MNRDGRIERVLALGAGAGAASASAGGAAEAQREAQRDFSDPSRYRLDERLDLNDPQDDIIESY